MRHAVFAHGDFNFHTGVINFTQYFFDAPHRLSEQRRRLNQFYDHHLAGFCHTGSTLRNQNILTVAFVFWRNQPNSAFLQKPANDRLVRALGDFNNTPLGATFAITAHDTDLNVVFVQHSPHLVRGKINIRSTVVAGHKTMSIPMPLNNSFNFFQQIAVLA